MSAPRQEERFALHIAPRHERVDDVRADELFRDQVRAYPVRAEAVGGGRADGAHLRMGEGARVEAEARQRREEVGDAVDRGEDDPVVHGELFNAPPYLRRVLDRLDANDRHLDDGRAQVGEAGRELRRLFTRPGDEHGPAEERPGLVPVDMLPQRHDPAEYRDRGRAYPRLPDLIRYVGRSAGDGPLCRLAAVFNDRGRSRGRARSG